MNADVNIQFSELQHNSLEPTLLHILLCLLHVMVEFAYNEDKKHKVQFDEPYGPYLAERYMEEHIE